MQQWYVKFPNEEIGPIADNQLIAFRELGHVTYETLVHNGDGNWVKANRIKGLFTEKPKADTLDDLVKIEPPSLPPIPTSAARHLAAKPVAQPNPPRLPTLSSWIISLAYMFLFIATMFGLMGFLAILSQAKTAMQEASISASFAALVISGYVIARCIELSLRAAAKV